MNEAKTCICGSENLVYSGVDAFMLGVKTEEICYTCASNLKK